MCNVNLRHCWLQIVTSSSCKSQWGLNFSFDRNTVSVPTLTNTHICLSVLYPCLSSCSWCCIDNLYCEYASSTFDSHGKLYCCAVKECGKICQTNEWVCGASEEVFTHHSFFTLGFWPSIDLMTLPEQHSFTIGCGTNDESQNIQDLYCTFSPWYNHNGWLGVKHQVTYCILSGETNVVGGSACLVITNIYLLYSNNVEQLCPFRLSTYM